MVEQSENVSEQNFTRCWTIGSMELGGIMMKYKDIKDFYERCDKHPDHQSGMISYSMIERRLHEEIEELRQYIEQRKWVGLTAEEVKDFQVNKFVGPNIIRAIERRLKEKNA
jgi:hypothetical protein